LHIEPRRVFVQLVVHDYLGKLSVDTSDKVFYTYSPLSGNGLEDKLMVRDMRFLGNLKKE
jgi:hypothetical protein